MNNLSSFNSGEQKGVVKCVEMTFYKIAFAQLTPSHINYLNENYSHEQVEILKNDFKESKFSMSRIHKQSQNKSIPLNEYKPTDLLSEDPNEVREWVKKYFRTGKTNWKLYKDNEESEITDHDIDAISEFLQGGFIKLAYRYQNLFKYDLDYINEVYSEVIKSDEHPFESIKYYFETFFNNHFTSEDESTLNPLQTKWKLILDWALSETLKEMFIKWVDYSDIDDGERESSTTKTKWKLIDIKFIDIDPKPFTKIQLI